MSSLLLDELELSFVSANYHGGDQESISRLIYEAAMQRKYNLPASEFHVVEFLDLDQ